MKEIFGQFGTAILAAMIATSLFLLMHTLLALDKSGVGSGIGNIYHSLTDAQLNQSFETASMQTYIENEGITVRYLDSETIYAGDEFLLSECLDARNANDQSVELHVIRIENESGDRFYERESDGRNYILLEEAGIYSFWLAGEDQNGVLRRVFIKIPVQAS